MSIGSIYSAKELSQTYQPLLLCQIQLVNGSTFYYSSHPLSAGYGGSPSSGSYEYAGQDWIPRIKNQEIAATQAMSDLGVDIVPQVSLVLADADKALFGIETTVGFKGAILTLFAAMWDAGNSATGSFNNDSMAPIKFIGTCSSAVSSDQSTMIINATSLLNMGQQQMPPIRIQSLCAWTFPPDEAARADGQSNGDSPHYECGYSPDIPGGVGNYQYGTAAFTFCDLSFAACLQRMGNYSATVPILKDNSGRSTGRYGGFDFVPIQNLGLQRPYITGQWELIINATNEARYGDYIPMCYGTTWVEPEIMGVYGDGNYTRCEALLSFGVVESIVNVICNGDLIPQLSTDYTTGPTQHITSSGITQSYKNNYWTTINNGQRNGNTNGIIGWSNKGDPYGSCAAIMVQVLASLAAASTIPQVQVLVNAGYVRVYTSPTAYTYQQTQNPAWILMDMLIKTSWRYSQINIASFISAAAVCDTQIYFSSITGTYQNYYNESGAPPYRRYSVGFSIKQRDSIGSVIRGIRGAMRGILFFDFNSGLLTTMCKQTLADQQPSTITGSNYTASVTSVTAAGVTAYGYVAYNFDGDSILKDTNGRSTLKISQKSFQETPNKTTNYFFDRENQWSQDISTIIDIEDVNRVGAEVTGNFQILGPQTFDHLNRCTATWFAENYRGNPRLDYEGSAIGDTGGTLQFEFETSMKALHLMVGQIVFISDAQSGIVKQLVRVTKIQPSMNFETAKITALWHNDNWYQDTFGQGANQPIYKNAQSNGQGSVKPWKADFEIPQVGDAYYDRTNLTFGLQQSYGKDANQNPLAQIVITGVIPVNSFPSSPLSPQLELIGQGITGGSYANGTSYFVAVSAVCSDNTISPISNIALVNLQSPSNGISVVAQAWPATASGYVAFVGVDPNVLTAQVSASVTSSVISIENSFQQGSWGAPDQLFSQLVVNISKEIHAGVWGAQVTGYTTSSVSVSVFPQYGFTTDQWANRELTVLGTQTDDNGDPVYVPIANFPVASNTSDTIVLSSGNPATCCDGNPLQIGDAVVMRINPTFGSDSTGNYFEDSLLINCLCELTGTTATIVDASNDSPIVLTIDYSGNFPFAVSDFVVVQNVSGNTAANGGFTLSAVDSVAGTITLSGSSGSGDYTSGGIVNVQVQGLIPQDEVGLVAYIIAGTGIGTSVKIASNTATRYYIIGNWPVTPDSSTRIVILDNVIATQPLTPNISNSDPKFKFSYSVPVTNYGRQALFVRVNTQSADGSFVSLQTEDPFREIFIFGQAGNPLSSEGLSITISHP